VAGDAVAPETLIEAGSGWQLINFRELWNYRDLLLILAWRDVKVRYKQTLLGAAWAILQPTLTMAVFAVFLGGLAQVPSGGIPYPLFVYLGLLPWTFFATAVASAGNSVVGSERLITKVYFPRLTIPFASVGAALVDFAIAFSVLILLMIHYDVRPAGSILLVPGLVALMVVAALAVGSLLAALNVSYRDFRYVIPFLVQLWMFATPSIYMATPGGAVSAMPSAVVGLLRLNPMTGLIGFFRAAVLGTPLPWGELGVSTLVIAVSFGLGCYYFRRVEDSFADII
jgi:lipopolysaccharide transport system permease protein